jgi:TPR repeat protein
MFSQLSWVHAEQLDEGMSAFQQRDYKKALAVWTELAEQGDVSAQINLANMYAKGLGAKKDRAQAMKWLEKAADQGNQEAMFDLGQLYGTQYGEIKADHELSLKWYLKAAEKGYANAQYAVGVKYFKGEGVTTDYVTAYAWMDVSMRNGYKPAESFRDLIGEVMSPEKLKQAKESAEEINARLQTQ